ncbi:MAG: hypothetical protein P4L36_10515 [Holophaga sp.]|nr:hypothetical protein [Holophaga sp.]
MRRMALACLVLLGIGGLPVHGGGAQTLPPEISSRMKTGKKLDLVWFDPHYDTASGFILGRLESLAEGRFAATVNHLPAALSRLTVPGSTNVLNLTVTDLDVHESYAGGRASATLAVEGQVLDQKGGVVFAFMTREQVDNRESADSDCQAVMDNVALAIAKELNGTMESAYQAKTRSAAKAESLIQLPAPAKAPEPQVSSSGARIIPLPAPETPSTGKRERLLQLEYLLKEGLVTREEYEKIRSRILETL